MAGLKAGGRPVAGRRVRRGVSRAGAKPCRQRSASTTRCVGFEPLPITRQPCRRRDRPLGRLGAWRGGWIAAAVVVAEVSACASTRPDSRAPHEVECAATSEDCAALRQRVRRLEARVRQLEDGSEASQDRSPGRANESLGAGLPVVKLTPPGHGGTEPPAGRSGAGTDHLDAGSTRELDAGEPSLAEPRESTTAETARPTAGTSSQPSAPDQPHASHAPVAVPLAAGEAGSGDPPPARYRLVGTRLVDLTKTSRVSERRRRGRARSGRADDPVLLAYREAMDLYHRGRYAEAERRFAQLARSHPEHAYADNALYWQGEAAYDQQRYADALAAFTDVVERYGGGNKAPDALLKIGLCYGRLGDRANAHDVLTQLIAAYPRSKASRVAKKRLSDYAETEN
ncbi:MAG: tol-pal system protein YbgF [Myxococcales bacterium FL481]|nr:MAG: tol-pal system protein YbgF [Myxococcales bacterium FL481]